MTGRHRGPKRKLQAGYRAPSLKQTSCCNAFSLSSVVSHIFSVLCTYSKFGDHPHPLGYLCAKFHFFSGPHWWTSPWRKIMYSIIHSITQHIWRPRTEAKASERLRPKSKILVLGACHWQCYGENSPFDERSLSACSTYFSSFLPVTRQSGVWGNFCQTHYCSPGWFCVSSFTKLSRAFHRQVGNKILQRNKKDTYIDNDRLAEEKVCLAVPANKLDVLT